MSKLIIKQGEAKPLTLTVTDGSGAAVDLSGATLLMALKKARSDAEYALEKDDAAFDKSQAAEGILTVNLGIGDSDLDEGTYIGELHCSWPGPPLVVEKSADFYLQIKGAVTG